MTADPPAVELKGITKRFPGVVANSDVNLTVRKGTIHAIVGENGAGKSTLMKILYGMQPPDEGEIVVDGKPVRFSSPQGAIEVGIGMVHQHFMLADNFTVTENVVLGAERLHGIGGRAKAKIQEISQRYGLGVRPDELVENLGVGDRQRVEILKVLYRGARILILDEPTAVLVPQEVDELFGNLRELIREGLTVLFISHKLDEVRAVADDITVIRRGTTVASVKPAEVTARQLATLMVGSELPSPEARESTVTDEPALIVEGLTVGGASGSRPLVDNATFTIHRGEVLGIAGVEGNGQAELAEAILGMRAATGTVRLGADDVSGWSTRRRREAGIGYIPEDRHRQGLLLDASLWENRILGHQTERPNARGFLIDVGGARRDTQRIVEQYDVRTPSIDVAAVALSGGNQQKLIVGREMSHEPKILIAAHPTRGVDVGAQAAIWDHIRNARIAGMGVLLISADLDELIGLSDSLKVIYGGRLVADADPATVTPEQLGVAMTGAASDDETEETPE
ncbi:ABC transporter ATP-binding protein [Dactylosporangium matsuzakiense]|uniref:Sugar ABC transporter ATP-binding protein n=1 Tax=Dactylosporangium matsuzakiense TaxID=53360 RepID=A0A9W6KN72_9ACTN|nr:ABC transporter ATP-binding protein [Dactylosporangium matsuzakiense]UWZ45734.1 ABC transporter ATP-binding protein [Dactylosporangium matsuzakiense]GLL04005.1 sugar ABC transporter ATP-binding protein [Dactylosporangium matsuzakiense]